MNVKNPHTYGLGFKGLGLTLRLLRRILGFLGEGVGFGGSGFGISLQGCRRLRVG